MWAESGLHACRWYSTVTADGGYCSMWPQNVVARKYSIESCAIKLNDKCKELRSEPAPNANNELVDDLQPIKFEGYALSLIHI